MAIKTLIFDLDNTLINRNQSIRHIHEWLVETYLKDKAQVTKEAALINLKGWDYFGYVPHETVLRLFCKTYGLDLDFNEVAKTIRANQGKHATLLDGALETLVTLSKQYTLALLTNGSSVGQRLKIDTAFNNHQSLFKEIMITGDSGKHKPDPYVYQALLTRLDVNPEDCVYIGDDLMNDIIAPLKLGMKTIRMNHCNLEPTDLTLEITHLSELLSIDFDLL